MASGDSEAHLLASSLSDTVRDTVISWMEVYSKFLVEFVEAKTTSFEEEADLASHLFQVI